MEHVAEFETRLFLHAIANLASDIHLEPREDEWEIRIRQQGRLQTFGRLTTQQANAFLQRIKLKADMDIGEKRVPQDGRFSGEFGKFRYDFRISTIPLINGERLAIRILYPQPVFQNLEQLGMSKEIQGVVLRWLEELNGLILITGPTGSGKTTTLYAILQHLNTRLLNIFTIEDPVEYRINGINQIQVNEKTGLSFAAGLRALMRQDPDVIMIGEIRDPDTAALALRAALSGHLVLASFHAGSAGAAVSRLQEMGMERAILTAAIKGILAQKMQKNPVQTRSKESSLPVPAFETFEWHPETFKDRRKESVPVEKMVR